MTHHIHHYWKTLQRYARLLLLGTSVFRLSSLLGGLLLLVAIGFSYNLPYDPVAYGALVLLLLGFCWAVVRFSVAWKPWSIQTTIVDFVETRVPALKGRSYLALDIDPPESFLRTRALSAVQHILDQISPRSLLSHASFKQAGKTFLLMMLMLGIGEWRLPVPPSAALLSLQSQSQYSLEQAKDAMVKEDAQVTIGDIVIEYTFPEYTNMTPVTIPNSNGEIHAPQGTSVRLRAKTLERFKAVQLEVNGVLQPASLNFGREVVADFDLIEEGTYRFLFFDGEHQLPSQEFPLVFDDDDPPVVSLEVKNTQIPSNRSIPMTWTATDDFGLERVLLEVESNGNIRQIVLRKPNQNRLKLGAKIRRSVEELGLKGGDVATLRLVAYDNQAPFSESSEPSEVSVEGEPFGKKGVSAPIEIQILTPQMSADQMKQLNQKLRDALVLVLADYLVERIPTEKTVYRWSVSAMKRYDPLRSITDEAWSEGWPTYLSAELIARIYADSASMFRFVRTTYSTDSLGKPQIEDIEYFQEVYTDHIAQLEQTIYIIDRMLRQVAFREVEQASKQLTRSAERFASMNMTEKSAQELLNSLSRVEKDLDKIEKSVEELGGYSVKEFVEQRKREIDQMESVIRQQLSEEKLDAASGSTEQMSQSVTQFAEGVSEILERMKSKEDEMEEEMESLIEKLEELDEKQQAKMQELQNGRQNDPLVQSLVDLWKEIEVQAEIAKRESLATVNGIGDGRGFRYGTIRSLEMLSSEMVALYGSVITRNIGGVEETVMMSGIRLKRVENVLYNEATRMRPASDPKPTELDAMNTHFSSVIAALVAIQKLLDSDVLDNAQSNPYLMDLAQKMAPEQSQLQQEMTGLLPKVQELEQQMPTATGEATEFAMQASKSMDEAYRFLESGDGVAGESLQFQSSARIQDTIEALKQAASQMQQMQQQTDQMAGGGEGDSESMSSQVELPPIEPRVSPEEYRKMLLEGMQGGVPEEYESLKKKYYEELVAQ